MNSQERKSPLENLQVQLHAIDLLLSPSMLGKKKKIKKSRIKIIYALHLIHKHNQKRSRPTDFPKLSTIAKIANVSIRTVENFILDPDFELYGSVRRQPWVSNEYLLYDWVYEFFDLAERLGMMRGFLTNFEGWKMAFRKRLHACIMPLAEREMCIKEIKDHLLARKRVANKLSTKNSVKLQTEDPFKLHPTTPSGLNNNLRVYNESEQALPILKEYEKIAFELGNRYKLQGSDLFSILNQFSLSNLKQGIRLRETYRINGIEARSEIKLMMSCVAKARNGFRRL